MTYEEFDKELRKEYPTITCRDIMELHKLEYPDQYTVVDTPPPPTSVGWWSTNQEVENTMSYNDEYILGAPTCMKIRKNFVSAPIANAQVIAAVPVESTQRDYAIERIKAIGEKHAQALRVQFHLDSQTPKTFLEMEAMIKAGDYTVGDLAKDDDARYSHIFYGVTFGKPADKEGYKAAKEVLKVFIQKALDQATLREVTELEAIIDGVEAWTLPTSTTAA